MPQGPPAPPTFPSLEKIPRSPVRESGWYTAADVSSHCLQSDCWISLLGIVYDITDLFLGSVGYLAEPLIRSAGRDISHWFDPRSKDVKMIVDPEMNMLRYFTPEGRFIHVPPKDPRIDWDTSYEIPWWFDTKYMIGRLSQRTRIICIRNVLISHGILLEVPSEETLHQILERYLVMNNHAKSYTWKAIVTDHHGEFINVNMDLNLDENGIKDESDEFSSLGMHVDHLVPCIHVYYDDDLTVG
ncbi:unnamed protein product [Calypogeia fissa]